MRNIRSNANGGARNILNWEEIEHFFFFCFDSRSLLDTSNAEDFWQKSGK